MGELERQGHSAAITVFRNFCNGREKHHGLSNKVKLNMMSYIEEVRVQRGQRVQHEGEMMWEGEYYDWARGSKAGFLTRQEAEKNWREWEQDPSVASDTDGPRGYKRLWIRTRDVIMKYQDLNKRLGIRGEDKMGKNTTAATLDSKMSVALSGGV